MATHSMSIGAIREQARESWVPMIAIALGQMIMSFNVASLPVALGGMVKSFGVPPTTVATGIVAYSMLVAGFVMLGAKLAQRFGALQVFRVAVVLFCASQILMTFSPTATLMITAQALCGAAGAVIVPSLVALIAENYTGRQQATAVGALGSARAARRRAGVRHRRRARHLYRLASGVRNSDRRFRHRFPAELPSQARLRPPGCADRLRRRRSGGVGDRSHQLRLQQSERLGPGAGHRQCAVQSARPFAGAGHDRCRHRARAGLPDVDAPAAGGREDAAAGARGDRLAAGARRRLRDVCRGRAGGGAQFLGAALHPDRAGPLAARDRRCDDAVQPDGVLHGDADRQLL